MSEKEFPIEPSSIETVDLAVYDWLDKQLNLFATTNSGWKKVPVIWIMGERSHQIKNDRGVRDTQGTFIFPVITLERTAINKDFNKKGIVWSALPEYNDVKGGSLEIGTKIVQNKSRDFARATNLRKFGQLNYPNENKKVVYQTVSIPLPVYVSLTYSVEIKTEYQQQMNELIQPFLTVPGGVNRVWVENSGHKFEAFIKGDMSQENNTREMKEEERMFTTKINVEVLGYLIGQGDNQNKPKVVVRETYVDVKVPRERIITGDIDEEIKNKRTI